MRHLLFIVTALLFFSACEKKCDRTTGDLSISFAPTYLGSPYVIFDKMPASNTDFLDFTLSKFEFFIYGLTLHNDNDSLLLTSAAYINLTQLNTEQKALDGFILPYDSLQPASYNRMTFTVGLPDDINNTTPDQYDTQSPLGSIGNYWYGWNSYILSKLEGNITRTDSTGGSFLIHSGVNGMSVAKSFDIPVEININEKTNLTINVAIDSVFYAYNQVINVDTSNMSHSGAIGSEAYNLAKQSLSNISKSLILN